ncbi:MAG: hypothetical protein J1F65_04975 [Clostridiales bacterium]|nr:hypothetical protein [Clostridiales bacterium]
MIEVIIEIIVTLVTIGCAIACPLIAKKKYRSVIGWAFAGAFLNIIGLIIILCLPTKY